MTTTEDFDADRQFVARYQGSGLARAVHLVAADIGEDGKARAYCRNYDPGQVFLSADPRAVTCRACLSHAEWLWKTRAGPRPSRTCCGAISCSWLAPCCGSTNVRSRPIAGVVIQVEVPDDEFANLLAEGAHRPPQGH